MSGQITIKIRTETKERLEIVARHYNTSLSEVVNCAAHKMLEQADSGQSLEIAMAKAIDELAIRVAEKNGNYSRSKNLPHIRTCGHTRKSGSALCSAASQENGHAV